MMSLVYADYQELNKQVIRAIKQVKRVTRLKSVHTWKIVKLEPISGLEAMR